LNILSDRALHHSAAAHLAVERWLQICFFLILKKNEVEETRQHLEAAASCLFVHDKSGLST
jgi:hypothetical protein